MKLYRNISCLLTIFFIFTILCSISKAYSYFKESENIKSDEVSINITPNFPDVDWWNKFNDPKLKEYIEKSINNNLEVKMANARILENNALVKNSLAKQLPMIDFNPSFSRFQNSENLTRPDINQFKNSGSKLFSPGSTYSIMQLPLSASYEPDFWLKNNSKRMVQKKYLAISKLELKSTCIIIESEVSTAYFNLLLANKLIEIEQQQIVFYKDYLKLLEARYNCGLIPYFEPLNIENIIQLSENSVHEYKIQKSLSENSLAVLTGESPGFNSEKIQTNLDDLGLISDIRVGVPSELCLRRPDILAAEAMLSAQKIQISIARKEFLPSINLSGQFGYSSTELSNLLDWKSHFASFLSAISQSIFAGGAKIANLKYNKHKYEELMYNYNHVILKSFQDVDNSMVSLKEHLNDNDACNKQVQIAKESLQLIKQNYEKGLISYLDVIEAENNLLDIKKQYYRNKTKILIDYVSLYKSLGGGY